MTQAADRWRPGQVAVAAGAVLALADGSIVVIALPELRTTLDASVEGLAAVIGVYTAVLAVALLPADALRRRIGAVRLGTAGLALFGAGSLGCGLAHTLEPLLAMRGAQALGGAAILVAAFALLDAGRSRGGRRAWTLAAIGGAAAGPALGGALTQAFDWSAIFLAQVPVALLGALACAALGGEPSHDADLRAGPHAMRLGAAAALALVSAALSAVLFLLVLMLVTGWSYGPLAGAAVLTVLPIAAIAALRVPGDPRMRAAAGALLVAGGVASLAPIASASAWWVIAAELAAGAGMGLALPALSELLSARTPADAARVLAVRHAGIAVALLLLAPITAARLDDAVANARSQQLAIVLGARVDPLTKLVLVGGLIGRVDEQDPRRGLERVFADARAGTSGEPRAELERAGRRADESVLAAVGDTFRPAFLIAAAFGLAAAMALLPWRWPAPTTRRRYTQRRPQQDGSVRPPSAPSHEDAEHHGLRPDR